MKIITLLATFFITSSLMASTVGLGLGGYALDTGTQKDADGGENSYTLHPGVNLSIAMQLTGANYFVPELGYVAHRSSEDTYGEQSKKTIYVLWDLSYQLSKSFTVQYGVGTFMTRIGGDGGTVTVRNGDSTATAYKPNETVTSYNTTLNFGAQYFVFSKTSLRLESFMFSFLSSEKRNLKYAATLHYYF